MCERVFGRREHRAGREPPAPKSLPSSRLLSVLSCTLPAHRRVCTTPNIRFTSSAPFLVRLSPSPLLLPSLTFSLPLASHLANHATQPLHTGQHRITLLDNSGIASILGVRSVGRDDAVDAVDGGVESAEGDEVREVAVVVEWW